MKIIKEIRVQETKFCLLCGSKGNILYKRLNDKLFRVPGEWNFLRCPKCSHVWLNPHPIIEDIGKVYQKYYTTSYNHTNKLSLFNRWRSIISRGILAISFGYDSHLVGKKERIAGLLLSWFYPLREHAGIKVMWLKAQRKGRILDVGCGNASFPAYMHDLGWEVICVEPDPKAVKNARKYHGIEVFQGTFERTSFPDNYFDAITLNHVIEHLTNPLEVLKKCNRMLKPKGKVVIITPNIKSFGHYLFKKNWLSLDPSRHFHLFSPKTIKICAKLAMLNTYEVRTIATYIRHIWLFSRVFKNQNEFQKDPSEYINWQLRLESYLFYAVEQLLIKVFPIGEDILMIACKKQQNEGWFKNR